MSRGEAVTRALRAARTIAILLWATALPVFAAGLIADQGEPDQALYSRGRALVFEESWQEARKVFQSLAKRHPRSTYLDDALYWTAFSLFEEGDAEGAYSTLKSMVESYPGSPWVVDARTLMVRSAEAVLTADPDGSGGRASAGDNSVDYRRFLDQSTRDSNAQVSLLAIDSLLTHEPGKAPDLLQRMDSSRGSEGAVVLLDRFFGNELVKVAFQDESAGLAEGNVIVLVRSGDRTTQLSLGEALDTIAGRGGYRFSQVVLREMRGRILEAERSLVAPAPIVDPEHASPGRRRTSTIVRVVDGEVHYYDNGAETLRIVVLKRAAGYSQQNVHIFVDTSNGPREVVLKDVTQEGERGSSARGLSADAYLYLTQSLGVIRLDLENDAK
jgi:hypothetical protein